MLFAFLHENYTTHFPQTLAEASDWISHADFLCNSHDSQVQNIAIALCISGLSLCKAGITSQGLSQANKPRCFANARERILRTSELQQYQFDQSVADFNNGTFSGTLDSFETLAVEIIPYAGIIARPTASDTSIISKLCNYQIPIPSELHSSNDGFKSSLSKPSVMDVGWLSKLQKLKSETGWKNMIIDGDDIEMIE